LVGEAEALARALDDQALLGRVLARMADVLFMTGDHDSAIVMGRQAHELAVALGDRALQGQASYNLGRIYYTLGNFDPAAELLRRNVEAPGWESSMPSTALGIWAQAFGSWPQAWLARTLSALGAFAEGRRHGEEALRLATLDSRGVTPILVH